MAKKGNSRGHLVVDFDVNEGDLRKIKKIPKKFKVGFARGVYNVGVYLEDRAKQDFEKSRSGHGGLHVRTGALRRSITHLEKKSGRNYTVGIYSKLIYAATHEWGRPAQNIPKRPFLKPAIVDSMREKQVERIIMEAISGAIGK